MNITLAARGHPVAFKSTHKYVAHKYVELIKIEHGRFTRRKKRVSPSRSAKRHGESLTSLKQETANFTAHSSASSEEPYALHMTSSQSYNSHEEMINVIIQVKLYLTNCCLIFSSVPPRLEHTPFPKAVDSITILL